MYRSHAFYDESVVVVKVGLLDSCVSSWLSRRYIASFIIVSSFLIDKVYQNVLTPGRIYECKSQVAVKLIIIDNSDTSFENRRRPQTLLLKDVSASLDSECLRCRRKCKWRHIERVRNNLHSIKWNILARICECAQLTTYMLLIRRGDAFWVTLVIRPISYYWHPPEEVIIVPKVIISVTIEMVRTQVSFLKSRST